MDFLITGGLGFIGSKIATKLISTGHVVTILDNQTSSVTSSVPGARVIMADLSDSASVTAVDCRPVDCVMHLAGPSSGPASLNDPVGTVTAGFSITYNVLELASRLGAGKFLHASSMTVYGDLLPEQNPITEDAPCRPISYYGIGKLANERLVEIFCQDRGFGFNNLRLFNVYGPGQDLNRLDQGLVSIFVAMLMKSPKIVSKGPLERFRAIVHDKVIVEAWTLCATEKVRNGAFNVGCGTAVTIRQLIDEIAGELDISCQLDIKIDDGIPGDIFGISADISALSEETGYYPKFPPDQGIRQFTRWALETKNNTIERLTET